MPEPVSRKPKIGRPSTRIEVRCLVCQMPFTAPPSEIKRGAGRFCSMICRDRAQALGITGTSTRTAARKPPVERTCETCGASFRVYPYRSTTARPARYCSEACRVAPPAVRMAGRGL
jgi:hypothetical protein